MHGTRLPIGAQHAERQPDNRGKGPEIDDEIRVGTVQREERQEGRRDRKQADGEEHDTRDDQTVTGIVAESRQQRTAARAGRSSGRTRPGLRSSRSVSRMSAAGHASSVTAPAGAGARAPRRRWALLHYQA